MRKLKEFSIFLIIGNQQLEHVIVTDTAKFAASQLGITPSYLRNYGYKYEPRTKEAIEERNTVFCFPSSELIKFDPNNKDKVMTRNDWKLYINEYNKIKIWESLKYLK